MNTIANTIAGRLSLREPQRQSLDILARVLEIAPAAKDSDPSALLQAIQREYPNVRDFERDFPSLCFALATGVGKTRLMGAFIAYLYLSRRSRHFFVLAPNLTIYNKLIADFTPGTPKYVFQGIAEFATAPPVVITGEDYEDGRGVRSDSRLGQVGMFRPGGEDAAHINVFNIAKISAEVRGGAAPRIKRLSEYVGDSYFDYLASLPDLVLLMDESHRYRAAAGMKALNDLKPILGLELTATPFVEATRGPAPFKNVVYGYTLAQALVDGFVKEPAVATRRDFHPAGMTQSQMERIKLEDGVRLHEQVKTDLTIYASQTGRPLVKPFMLVIARDTEHARDLRTLIQSAEFFGGRYANMVIEVHSGLGGEEKEETVARLLAVESAGEPTEIVIHVNMLKEGWDVTNLYTIVPLRAANARTLIEQSIGRGLRLPYGRRVGVDAVDRLTIVAHDRFQEIVDEANRGDSILRKLKFIELDPTGAAEPQKPIVVQSVVELVLSGLLPMPAAPQPPRADTDHPATEQVRLPVADSAPPPNPFASAAGQAVAQATMAAIRGHEKLRSAAEMQRPEVLARIVEQVKATLPVQSNFAYPEPTAALPLMVRDVVDVCVAMSIDIPNIVVEPTGEVTIGFEDFDLDTSGIRLQPVPDEILIQHLRTNHREHLAGTGSAVLEERPENYVVRALIDFDDVEYDAHAELLYKWAGQVVAHLASYLEDPQRVQNVLIIYQARLADLVHAQMARHRIQRATGYRVTVTRGFRTLRSVVVSLAPGESPRLFRAPIEDRRNIPQMVFEGFRKCLYPLQKFDSDPERRFAVILESDDDVKKWVKPAKGNFQIDVRGGNLYEPDFVVETTGSRFLVEVKRGDSMDDEEVLAKMRAAIVWCEHATEHTKTTDGKPWRYLLIPDGAIRDNMSLDGLAREFERKG